MHVHGSTYVVAQSHPPDNKASQTAETSTQLCLEAPYVLEHYVSSCLSYESSQTPLFVAKVDKNACLGHSVCCPCSGCSCSCCARPGLKLHWCATSVNALSCRRCSQRTSLYPEVYEGTVCTFGPSLLPAYWSLKRSQSTLKCRLDGGGSPIRTVAKWACAAEMDGSAFLA